jgi:hypothetical protein
VEIYVLAVALNIRVQTNLNLYFPHLLSDWGEIWYMCSAKLYCSEFVSLLTFGTRSPSLPYGCKWNNIFTCTVQQYVVWQYSLSSLWQNAAPLAVLLLILTKCSPQSHVCQI